MKRKLIALFVFMAVFVFAQTKRVGQNQSRKYQISNIQALDLKKINDSVPDLIPQKKEGKFGFINQKGKLLIPNIYSNVGFFAEDCNLQNSTNELVRKFGTSDFASVRLDGEDYRINKQGKRVYKYKDADLAKCPFEYKQQKFHSYIRQGYYGIVEREKFENENDYRQYVVYPQYEYLHILEGDDLQNPMIIAVANNRFGVINIRGEAIIPFEYSDIKRNFSWKLARLFEVTKDGENYYFVDSSNHAY
ncbi:MAG: WG repeat-containing protein [Cruoricaptor ignavus]|nr:WG repeat-containing protein [Cruoricaptor ignavus]